MLENHGRSWFRLFTRVISDSTEQQPGFSKNYSGGLPLLFWHLWGFYRFPSSFASAIWKPHPLFPSTHNFWFPNSLLFTFSCTQSCLRANLVISESKLFLAAGFLFIYKNKYSEAACQVILKTSHVTWRRKKTFAMFQKQITALKTG